MQSLSSRFESIQAQLAGASLIAVSKYAEDQQLIEAYELGLRDFAENYVIPAIDKKQRLNLAGVRWHLIGPLQSNKVNKAVGEFDLIHSVHSLELAEQINKRAEKLGIKQKILLQVNFTDKNGFAPEQVREAYSKVLELANIDLQGLMTMGPHKISAESETIYQRMRQMKEELVQAHSLGVLELSMGMSNDYHLALQHGSTMVRIGSALFGERLTREKQGN
ncbi:MAG: YggS family pyridoxal phosphate-dependent enzyme [Candidatus Melainabacteria bacterium]|nr:YggS family pyridoxal phosphate-dependent enzyme [Candidatus Melainabacteria bacterium]